MLAKSAFDNGLLQNITDKLFNSLKSCSICPRKCKVNRLKNETGFCKTGIFPRVYSFMAHHGEEPPISGTNGSGTIFFSGCNMNCVYCQNYKFSQSEQGKETNFEDLAQIMLHLQELNCHNINLVTPTHILPQILKSLIIAIDKGLKLPIVYNTSGYESVKTIKALNGIIDIYLADMRYHDPQMSLKYSNAPEYPKHNQEAIKEMHNQVGVAKFNQDGIMERGLIIRHLVLPNNISGTEDIMKFIASEISPETYISLMSQYTPYYKSNEFKEISRKITLEEYKEAEISMERYGLHNGWTQDSHGLESLAGVNIKPKTLNNKKP
ncbi:MAG: radical SAM protein [Candidatus Omnitrophica bacterium]|nr:radical SAM protein [Candidatus Omnitrophota bacterium]